MIDRFWIITYNSVCQINDCLVKANNSKEAMKKFEKFMKSRNINQNSEQNILKCRKLRVKYFINGE